MFSLIIAYFLFIGLLENVSGSHFLGGVIMLRPKPSTTTNEMEISFQIAWRRSHSAHYCDSSTVKSGNLIGSGSLGCQSGCSGTVGSMAYQCTDFSVLDDWSYGGNTIYYTFPASTSITIGYGTICCWISPFDSNNWNIRLSFSTTPRNDTNVINSTPRAITAPVIRLQAGCTHTITIPVTDPDDDIVKCRWATGTECTGICNSIPGATLDSESCTISYVANQGTGYKAVALAIEDFMTVSSSTPLSTVNLQFMVLVVSSNQSCSAAPALVSPTLMQGASVEIAPGDTFNTQVVADSQSSAVSISDFITASPSGTIKKSVNQTQNSNLYYVNISWTPSTTQQCLTHLLCYSAVNSNGVSSEQVCIKINTASTTAVNFTGIAISSTAIYLSWDVSYMPDDDKNSIQYYIVECDELETEREWSFFAVEAHAHVISLHPFHSYSCRIQIVGKHTYCFNNAIVVDTHQAAPTAPPQNVSSIFSDLLSSTLNVTWCPPPSEQLNGIIKYYIIKMTEVETSIGYQFTSNYTHIYLTSLHPYYWYTFQIAAVTIAEGPLSNNFTVLMPEDAPSSPPINITAVDVTTSSITIEWSPPNPSDVNGIIIMYLLNITRIETRNTLIKQILKDTLFYKQQDLGIYEIISVSIAARTAVGWGPYSELHFFRTLEDLPSSPVDLKGELTSDGAGVVLTWKIPSFPNGNIVGYQIIYSGHERTQSSISDGPYIEFVNTTDHNQVTIINLVRGYFYTFKIRGRNKAGFGENGTIVVLTPAAANISANESTNVSGDSDQVGNDESPGVTNMAIITSAGAVIFVMIFSIVAVLLIICIIKRKSKENKSTSAEMCHPNLAYSQSVAAISSDGSSCRSEKLQSTTKPLFSAVSNVEESGEYEEIIFKPLKVSDDLTMEKQLSNINDSDQLKNRRGQAKNEISMIQEKTDL